MGLGSEMDAPKYYRGLEYLFWVYIIIIIHMGNKYIIKDFQPKNIDWEA